MSDDRYDYNIVCTRRSSSSGLHPRQTLAIVQVVGDFTRVIVTSPPERPSPGDAPHDTWATEWGRGGLAADGLHLTCVSCGRTYRLGNQTALSPAVREVAQANDGTITVALLDMLATRNLL